MGTDRYSMTTDNTLWIFGDSFATPTSAALTQIECASTNPTPKQASLPLFQWSRQLQQLLPNCSENIQIYSQFGISNEWLFDSMRNHHSMIQTNDYVVLITTDANRRWFFQDRPNVSGLSNIIDFPDGFSNAELNAVKSYVTHLHNNPILSECYHETLIGWAAHLSNACRYKLCVIPAFETTPLHSAYGSLNNVCNQEFDDAKLRDYFYSLGGHADRRVNHMSKVNHGILAQKLADYFVGNTERINLDDGFVTHIYKTKEDCEKYEM